MTIYIPQNIDPYNTHLKNLVNAYYNHSVEIIVGYDNFITKKLIPDIIHFHQPEGILNYINFNETLFFECLEDFKNKGVTFLYTAHNLVPHAKNIMFNYNVFLNKFFGYINLFIHHGKTSVNLLHNKYVHTKKKQHIVCPHGDYLSDMSCFNETQNEARVLLNLPINKKIVLVFGQLQYKNPKFIKDVFSKIKIRRNDLILLMAGVYPIFKYNRINKLYYILNNKLLNCFRSSTIKIHKRFSQHEAYLIFKASDLIFLPHNSGLTSGIIPMAATLGKPFVYPDIGVFKDQAKYCIAENYKNSNSTLAVNAIIKVLNLEISSFDNIEWLKNNNWDLHVKRILEALKNISLKK